MNPCDSCNSTLLWISPLILLCSSFGILFLLARVETKICETVAGLRQEIQTQRLVSNVPLVPQVPQIQFTNMPTGDVPLPIRPVVRQMKSVPIKKVPAHFDLCKLAS